jgi:DNA-binding PadR family transcriptional regulator
VKSGETKPGIARFANLFYDIKQMSRREEPLGPLEHIVLLAVMRLGEEAYGVAVRREIESTIGRNVSVGAAYATLVRLESKGFVRSSEGEATAERGGRAKRYFRVTADGKAALRNTREIIEKMSAGLKGMGAT